MNNKELEKNVKQFTSMLSYMKGYVSSVDVLIKHGYITESDYQNWRFGKIPYLEKPVRPIYISYLLLTG